MDYTPVTVVCNGSCTVAHTVSIDVQPFTLSMEDGASIASAILAVWAIAWGFRALIRFLRDSDGVSPTEE